MPRYKRSERDELMVETRDLLLDAATEAFAAHGYTAANVNSISRAAGYSKGTIYNYFESKRALMLEVLDRIAKQHLAYIRERVLEEDDPLVQLEQFFQAGFDYIAEHLTAARVMLSAINGPDPEFKQRMFTAYSPMFELVGKDIIGVGVAQGVFREVDVVTTAGLIMNIYLGTGSQVDEEGHPWIPAGQVADFVRNALEARS